ncbi:uncharacterized protein LOC119453514 [Dermacentor silvarum]|uniref:uncharacterized protein LOC119453514 n=1 Tax=Dermacentor silvarum TaxID=543639 RepID=UPI0018975C93|nr:uncharacterized protein LOC119453514 [Dermacentor silvarum]
MKIVLWSTASFGFLFLITNVGYAKSDDASNDADKLFTGQTKKYGLVEETSDPFLGIPSECIIIEMPVPNPPYTIIFDCANRTKETASSPSARSFEWDTLIYTATTSPSNGSSVNDIITFVPDDINNIGTSELMAYKLLQTDYNSCFVLSKTSASYSSQNQCYHWKKIEAKDSCPIKTEQTSSCDDAFDHCKLSSPISCK